MNEITIWRTSTCTDSESCVTVGEAIFFFFSLRGEGGGQAASNYHYKRAMIGLPAKRQLIGPTLNAGLEAS